MARSKGPTLTSVRSAVKKAGHIWHVEPFEFNLVGIRTPDQTPWTFNDWITLSWGDDLGMIFFRRWRASTQAGVFWRGHPANSGAGEAHLQCGRYPDLWRLGRHRGRDFALMQRRKVKLWATRKQRKTLSFDPAGRFGANLHHHEGELYRWAPGAQVMKNKHELNELISIVQHCQTVKAQGCGYTLVEALK